jgi:3-deoxy-D-manno-octulosonate 8-phosphate phosphatase (KDO 8-P phosphatase)
MPSLSPAALTARAQALTLVLFDVDGVLTDGGVYVDADGRELKRFSIKDGGAIALAPRFGLRTGLLSARTSPATAARAAELGMAIVRQNVRDKRAALDEVLAAESLGADAVAFMGDDLIDLGVMSRVGLSACPADAAAEVAAAAHWQSRHPGGRGAAREFIETILKARGQWDDVLKAFA